MSSNYENQGRRPDQVQYSEKIAAISVLVILGIFIAIVIVDGISKLL